MRRWSSTGSTSWRTGPSRRATTDPSRESRTALRTAVRTAQEPREPPQRQQERLAELEANFPLKTLRAWALKEMLRHLWTYKRKAWARRFLDLWFRRATHSRLAPMRKFAWMLRRHYEGILAWFDLPIGNGIAEAMNNNAKAISHRARGYRSAKAFRLSMLHCLGALRLPETAHRFA
ncbi:MAG: transposase [Actinomycetota bacterium]